MPWIQKETCDYCGVCIEECPAGAICGQGAYASINMDRCIRCGVCHTVCPVGAVRHDSEKIPAEVQANVEKTLAYMERCAQHLGNDAEKEKCLKRMIKSFNKEKKVAEQTIAKLKAIL